MTNAIPKIYDPQQSEGEIYRSWEDSGYFNPDNLEGEPYSIMMPPPNVTGVLHLGHSLENALMDIMARYQRLKGKKVLLLPGTDHAAVATQAKVEKLLQAQGIRNPRQELGREKLLGEIRTYAEKSKTTILSQIRRMGTSCDWSRLAYTFDEKRSRAVNEVFVRMYADGLIYRGYRVINWSVKGQSTCSDDELEYQERPAKLYTFRYSADFPMSIATTRPETKLGDTAVAVNPKDERYSRYIGQTFEVNVGAAQPLKIRIIADDGIDPEFGTGAVGVTPAHSPVDFLMYEKQKALGNPIDLIPVIDEQGKMTAQAGSEYAGLSVAEAREKFIQWLKDNSLLEKEEEILQNVGTSDRFGDVVEAIPMTQWFVDVNKQIPGKGRSLKELMQDAVLTGHGGDPSQRITITPERFEKTYLNWIDNLRDWCISRQIWWGHRIPVWYREEELYCGAAAPEGSGWEQDPDTLDTWFSSALWTFSTLGWPEETGDWKIFHPTSWMQMGYEILFFWMARMILMTTYTLDQIPFRQVYIHGMLRDEKGNKFSKSAGNNIDPLEVIGKYGTDALRLSLISGITPGNDSKFYEEKVESARNFINKLWNISRYILSSAPAGEDTPHPEDLRPSDVWILEKFCRIIDTVSRDIESFRFSQAAEDLTEFTRSDLADWYLEVAKFEDNRPTKTWILRNILEDLLRLWHPFIPFVTENIWSSLGKNGILMTEKWPQKETYADLVRMNDKDRQFQYFEKLQSIIGAIRNIRIENGIDAQKKIVVIVRVSEKGDAALKAMLERESELIKRLRTGAERIQVEISDAALENAFFAAVGEVNIYVASDGVRDTVSERQRTEKEIAELEKYASGIRARLEDSDFAAKAPAKIVADQEKRLAQSEEKLSELRGYLKRLQEN